MDGVETLYISMSMYNPLLRTWTFVLFYTNHIYHVDQFAHLLLILIIVIILLKLSCPVQVAVYNM